MRRAARRDDNDSELETIATQLGALMIATKEPADYLCWWRGWHVVEIKRPDKEGWKSEYTEAQIRFRMAAKERGAELWTWRCEDDVYESLGARRSA